MKLLFENWHKYLSEDMSEEKVQSIADRLFPQIVRDRGVPAGRQGIPKIELHANIYARYSDIKGMKREISDTSKAEWVDKDNTIYVYYPNMTNEEDIIRSLLHEFEHAHQDPEEYEVYRKQEEYDGQSNPLEVEARDAEEKWKNYLVDWAGDSEE